MKKKVSWIEYNIDGEVRRSYWLKNEINPDSVLTTYKDYSLENYFNDLNDVFDITLSMIKKVDHTDRIKTKKSIYYIISNSGPFHMKLEEVAKNQNMPIENIKGMAKMFWFEIKLLSAIFTRDVEEIKKLSAEDQLDAFNDLFLYTVNFGGKYD